MAHDRNFLDGEDSFSSTPRPPAGLSGLLPSLKSLRHGVAATALLALTEALGCTSTPATLPKNETTTGSPAPGSRVSSKLPTPLVEHVAEARSAVQANQITIVTLNGCNLTEDGNVPVCLKLNTHMVDDQVSPYMFEASVLKLEGENEPENWELWARYEGGNHILTPIDFVHVSQIPFRDFSKQPRLPYQDRQSGTDEVSYMVYDLKDLARYNEFYIFAVISDQGHEGRTGFHLGIPNSNVVAE